MNEVAPDRNSDPLANLELIGRFEQNEADIYGSFCAIAGAMGEQGVEEEDFSPDIQISDGIVRERRKFNVVPVVCEGRSYTVALGEDVSRPFGNPHAMPEIEPWIKVRSTDEGKREGFDYRRLAMHFLPAADGRPPVGLSEPGDLLDLDEEWLTHMLKMQAEYKGWIDLAYETVERQLDEDDEGLL